MKLVGCGGLFEWSSLISRWTQRSSERGEASSARANERELKLDTNNHVQLIIQPALKINTAHPTCSRNNRIANE